MDTFRPGRTKDEWMMFHKEMLACSRKVEYDTAFLDKNLLARVKLVDRLASDIFAQKKLWRNPPQDRC